MAHFAHGGFQLLMMTMMLLIFGIMIAVSATDSNGPPAAFFAVFMVFILVFNLIFTLPSFIAGYGFWKKKSWARTTGIIAGVLAAMNFPIGTATCVYTFWFLFSDPGKELYDTSRHALPPPPPVWATVESDITTKRAARTPPDWR